MRSSEWSGTGTVRPLLLHDDVAAAPTDLPITMLRQNGADLPAGHNTQSTNRDLDQRYVKLALQSALDLVSRGAFKEQIERFPQVVARLLNRIPLTGNIEFRAKRDISRSLAFDDGGQSHGWLTPTVQALSIDSRHNQKCTTMSVPGIIHRITVGPSEVDLKLRHDRRRGNVAGVLVAGGFADAAT